MSRGILFVIFAALCCGRAMALQAVEPTVATGKRHAGFATIQGGQGGNEYWIFTPEEPRPAEAPVVVFVHGWGGMDPYVYGAWLKHLVLRGNIVIYPRYQANIKTRLDDMTPHALVAVQAAYKRLRAGGPVRPNRELAFVGHSMGGFIATNLAALSSQNGLPAPAALMVIEPGDGEERMKRLGERVPLADAAKLPDSMLVLLVTGDADTVVGDKGAAKIWQGLRKSRVEAKVYITVGADQQTMPKDAADHFAPLATDEEFDPEFSLHRRDGEEDESQKKGFFARRKEARQQRLIDKTRGRWADKYEPDAMDYDGYWKMLDEMLDAAFGPNSEAGFKEAARRWVRQFDREAKPGKPRIVKRVE